jgi:hypothetical protein
VSEELSGAKSWLVFRRTAQKYKLLLNLVVETFLNTRETWDRVTTICWSQQSSGMNMREEQERETKDIKRVTMLSRMMQSARENAG